VSVSADDESRLAEVEAKIQELSAHAGTVRLGPATLTLLWIVLIASMSAVGFVVRLDGKVDAQAKILQDDDAILDAHVKAPGHSVDAEKITELGRRIDSIEEFLKKEGKL
jgi:hypothetical protein